MEKGVTGKDKVGLNCIMCTLSSPIPVVGLGLVQPQNSTFAAGRNTNHSRRNSMFFTLEYVCKVLTKTIF